MEMNLEPNEVARDSNVAGDPAHDTAKTVSGGPEGRSQSGISTPEGATPDWSRTPVVGSGGGASEASSVRSRSRSPSQGSDSSFDENETDLQEDGDSHVERFDVISSSSSGSLRSLNRRNSNRSSRRSVDQAGSANADNHPSRRDASTPNPPVRTSGHAQNDQEELEAALAQIQAAYGVESSTDIPGSSVLPKESENKHTGVVEGIREIIELSSQPRAPQAVDHQGSHTVESDEDYYYDGEEMQQPLLSPIEDSHHGSQAESQQSKGKRAHRHRQRSSSSRITPTPSKTRKQFRTSSERSSSKLLHRDQKQKSSASFVNKDYYKHFSRRVSSQNWLARFLGFGKPSRSPNRSRRITEHGDDREAPSESASSEAESRDKTKNTPRQYRERRRRHTR